MLKALPCPISGQQRCKERDCELHYMSAPVTVANVGAILESTLDFDWSIVDLSAAARARRGMDYVRRVYPLARDEVLWGVLDTMSTARCVLGQIHGRFERSPEARNASIWWLQAHGFVPLVVDSVTEAEDAYELDHHWRQAFLAWHEEAGQ